MAEAECHTSWDELGASRFEAEEDLVWRYFHSPRRSSATDAAWLRRQCFKEMWGSGVTALEGGLFVGPIRLLGRVADEMDHGFDRHRVLAVIEQLHSEFRHYCLFADLHDALTGETLRPGELCGWPTDDELARRRRRCRARFGALGDLAVRFTEGGAGALYAAGMRLAGSGAWNDRIAQVCAEIHADEIAHMRSGAEELTRRVPRPADAPELAATVRELLDQRLRMRAEQFGTPLELPPR